MSLTGCAHCDLRLTKLTPHPGMVWYGSMAKPALDCKYRLHCSAGWKSSSPQNTSQNSSQKHLLAEDGETLEAHHFQLPLLKADFRAIVLFPLWRLSGFLGFTHYPTGTSPQPLPQGQEVLPLPMSLLGRERPTPQKSESLATVAKAAKKPLCPLRTELPGQVLVPMTLTG